MTSQPLCAHLHKYRHKPPPPHRQDRPPQRPQGMALIEALMASAVLGVGLAGAMQLTLQTLHVASESRQHSVAQHLAQQTLDCLRSGSPPCNEADTVLLQGVRYTLQAQSTPRGGGQLRDLQVSVEWVAVGTRRERIADALPINRLVWHSSASALPAWVGVSSP